jgi:hypothetical protein
LHTVFVKAPKLHFIESLNTPGRQFYCLASELPPQGVLKSSCHLSNPRSFLNGRPAPLFNFHDSPLDIVDGERPHRLFHRLLTRISISINRALNSSRCCGPHHPCNLRSTTSIQLLCHTSVVDLYVYRWA